MTSRRKLNIEEIKADIIRGNTVQLANLNPTSQIFRVVRGAGIKYMRVELNRLFFTAL